MAENSVFTATSPELGPEMELSLIFTRPGPSKNSDLTGIFEVERLNLFQRLSIKVFNSLLKAVRSHRCGKFGTSFEITHEISPKNQIFSQPTVPRISQP